MFLVFSMMISMISIFMNHPLTLGLCLLMQTVIYAIISGMIAMNFWYSYILFLMMVSGMLILFMYMTSITSNKKFYMSKSMLMMIILFIPLMSMNSSYLNTSINSPYYSLNLNLNNFFNNPMIPMMIMMMIYLLLTLVASVKIININKGPLRQKF